MGKNLPLENEYIYYNRLNAMFFLSNNNRGRGFANASSWKKAKFKEAERSWAFKKDKGWWKGLVIFINMVLN